MGAPPEGKGGKKGKPPPPAKSTDTQGKGKGKGASSGVAQAVPLDEAALNLFFKVGPDQQEDGHWEGEGIINSVLGAQIFQTAEQKTGFLNECPFLSTLLMIHVGRTHMPKLFGHNKKQERQVKLGDGRTQADDVEVKMVELSEEEKAHRQEEREGFFERLRIRMDWDDLAENFLKQHPLSGQRAALEERVRAMIVPAQPKPAKASLTAEERKKREEARAEAAAAMRKKEQDALAAKVARLQHLQTLPPADIQRIHWSNAKELHFMEGGSGGVMVVDLQDSCVVLKQQGKAAAIELLAEQVANAIGVRVAHVRVVRRGDSELQEILDNVRQCRMFGTDPVMGFGKFFGIHPDLEAQMEEWKKQAKFLAESVSVGALGILEFVPGHTLMGIHGNQLMKSPSPNLLYELGCLCALDVLINNLDRMPLPIWQNEGNLGNVMVIDNGSSVIGIDQQVNSIMEGPARNAYIEKVKKLIDDAKPGGESKAIVAKLQEAMMENCGSELSDANAQLIVNGLYKGFEAIATAVSHCQIKQALDKGEQTCFERLIFDGACLGTKPVLDIMDEANKFVCIIASQIADHFGVKEDCSTLETSDSPKMVEPSSTNV